MLLRCFRAEMRKLRGSVVWLVFLAVPLISAIYGTFNYLQNQDVLSESWYSLFTQHTLFYSMFFFAPMVGVYAGYLWRLEHRGGNWNLMMAAPVPRFTVFAAKGLARPSPACLASRRRRFFRGYCAARAARCRSSRCSCCSRWSSTRLPRRCSSRWAAVWWACFCAAGTWG